MVRTSSAGIKISSGKSSKKGGGGGGGAGRSSSGSSLTSSRSSAKGSSRLPAIPHQETPSWQKPITNFFQSESSSSENTNSTNNVIKDDIKHTKQDQPKASVEENEIESGNENNETNLANSQENQKHIEGNLSNEKLSEQSKILESLENDTESDQMEHTGKEKSEVGK